MQFEVWANGKPYWNSPKILFESNGAEVTTVEPKCVGLQTTVMMLQQKYLAAGMLFPEVRVKRFEEVG